MLYVLFLPRGVHLLTYSYCHYLFNFLEYPFDMDLMENYPFKDKDFAFVALYASIF